MGFIQWEVAWYLFVVCFTFNEVGAEAIALHHCIVNLSGYRVLIILREIQKRGLLSWSFLNGLTSINVLNADVMACSLFIVSS